MIKIVNATKQYKSVLALDNVNIEIASTGIYCLLGRNGAGKTTLLKSIAGHQNLTGGEIFVNGKKVSMLNMPENLSFIEAQGRLFNFKLKHLIKYCSKINEHFDLDYANAIAAKFKLDLNKRYKAMSFGMKTMVTTLLSLAGNDETVLLDEPVLGLDAIMRDRFYNLLQESLETKPRIIIISTHLIDEIAKVAQKIIIISEGRILDYFDAAEMDEKGYSLTGLTATVKDAVKDLRVISEKTVGGFTTAAVFDKRIPAPKNCTIQAIGLQDYFIALVGGENND